MRLSPIKRHIAMLSASVLLAGMIGLNGSAVSHAASLSQTGGWSLSDTVAISGAILAEAPNGTLYVLENKTGTIVQFSATGQPITTWAIHAEFMALSPGGSTLYALTHRGTIQAINTSTTKSILSWTGPKGLNGGAAGLLVSPNGQVLYAYDPNVAVTAYSTSTGKTLWKSGYVPYEPHMSTSNETPLPMMTITPNGNDLYIPAVDAPENTEVTDLTSVNTVLHTIQGISPSNIVDVAVSSPGGNTIYLIADPVNLNGPSRAKGSLMLLNPATNTVQQRFPLQGFPTTASVDASTVFIGNTTHVYLWNRQTKKITGDISNPSFHQIDQIIGTANSLAVLTNNGLYLYSDSTHGSSSGSSSTTGGTSPNSGTGSTSSSSGASGSGSSASGTATTYSVALTSGWNLVDQATAQAASSDTAFYWAGTQYQSQAPHSADGEWVYSPQSTSVTVTAPSAPNLSITAASKAWTMIGNPLSVPVTTTLQPGDSAFTYNASTHQYQTVSGSTLQLSPGQGAWLYSASGGTYVLTVAPPPPPTTGG